MRVDLKWINDIFIKERKVGGVLIKTNIIGNRCFIEVGIGVNLSAAPMPESTCVMDHYKGKLSAEELREKLIDKMTLNVIEMVQKFEVKNILMHYEDLLMYKGK